MFRILGFILGSAASIVGIFMVLGVPEVHLSGTESDQARFDAALQKIRDRQPASEEFATAIEDVVSPTEAVVDEAEESPPVETVLPAVVEKDDESIYEPLTEPQDVYNPDQHWHEFWNPFRSEIAARGFVSQLEKVTGLDYRVMKINAGVYQVGFA